jgi:protein SDA1
VVAEVVKGRKEKNRSDKRSSGAVFIAQKRKEKAAKEGYKVNFPALDLLHDPQRFGEDLYDNLQKHGTF